MNEAPTLVLPAGTAISLNTPASIVVPELLEVEPGDTIELRNEQNEDLGSATVDKVYRAPFAMLQRSHFVNNAHPELGAWPNAHEFFKRTIPGFTQLEYVTVLSFTPTHLPEPAADQPQETAE